MPSREEAYMRHAQYYAEVATAADRLYREGHNGVGAGLTLFDENREQIDSGWIWARAHHTGAAGLILAYADGTVYVGDLRYDKHRERIPQWEEALAAAQQLDHSQAIGVCMNNLSGAYLQLGDVHQAQNWYKQGLVVAREIEDRAGEGAALTGLGLTYQHLGEV